MALRRWLFLVILTLGPTATVATQDRPDFSGRWVLESASQATADTPRVLSVKQTLVRTNVRGESIKPLFKDIIVDRELESGTRSEAHIIGVVGGVISGEVSGQPTAPRRHHAVRWEGNTLVFESGSYTGHARETGVWTERREVWSLESGGRLRLTVESRSSVGTQSTVTLIYRREGPAA